MLTTISDFEHPLNRFDSIFRAYTNMKISAPVCFITLSAPSITMYAMTTVAQPSPEREAILETSPELTTRWDEIHRNGFVPVMHVMMFLSIVGFASSLHSLAVRWDEFNRKPFSPAHAAFVFPVLSHTNAIQSYRRVIIGFSLQPSTYHYIITVYWIFCLLGGTIINLICKCDLKRRDEEGDLCEASLT
jgi:tellurite resistance protein TehA-like permease